MKLKWTLLLGALVPFALTAAEIEAETGKTSDLAVIKANDKASGGKTVTFKIAPRQMKKPEADEVPALTINAKVEKDAVYNISIVIYTPNTSSDSVFCAIDDAPAKDKHFGFPHAGKTVLIAKSKLSAGEHQIKFWSREPNLEIDKIIIEEAK